MGLFSGLLGGGDKAPTLRAPEAPERAGLAQLEQRGAAGTQLSLESVANLLRLMGPETETQLQALSQLQALLSGQPFTSPSVEESIRRQRQEREARILRQLGPGGEISTPGMEALERGATEAGLLREGARGQELQNLLGVLGLLGPQARQTAATGFAEPSPGILRTTGVQERLGELGAQSNIAAALIRSQPEMLSQLGAGAGGIGQLIARLLKTAGPVAAVATGNPALALPGIGGGFLT